MGSEWKALSPKPSTKQSLGDIYGARPPGAPKQNLKPSGIKAKIQPSAQASPRNRPAAPPRGASPSPVAPTATTATPTTPRGSTKTRPLISAAKEDENLTREILKLQKDSNQRMAEFEKLKAALTSVRKDRDTLRDEVEELRVQTAEQAEELKWVSRELAETHKSANDARCHAWLDSCQGRSTVLAAGLDSDPIEPDRDGAEAEAEAEAMEYGDPGAMEDEAGRAEVRASSAVVAGFAAGTDPSLLESALREMRRQLAGSEETVRAQDREVTELRETLELTRRQAEAAEAALQGELEARANQVEGLKALLDSEREQMREQTAQEAQLRASLEAKLVQFAWKSTGEKEAVQTELEASQARAEKLALQLEASKQTLSEKETQQAAQRLAAEDLQARLEASEANSETLAADLAGLREAVETSQASAARGLQETAALAEERDRLKSELEVAQQMVQDSEGKARSAQEALAASKDELLEMHRSAVAGMAAAKKVEDLERELSQAHVELRHTKNELISEKSHTEMMTVEVANLRAAARDSAAGALGQQERASELASELAAVKAQLEESQSTLDASRGATRKSQLEVTSLQAEVQRLQRQRKEQLTHADKEQEAASSLLSAQLEQAVARSRRFEVEVARLQAESDAADLRLEEEATKKQQAEAQLVERDKKLAAIELLTLRKVELADKSQAETLAALSEVESTRGKLEAAEASLQEAQASEVRARGLAAKLEDDLRVARQEAHALSGELAAKEEEAMKLRLQAEAAASELAKARGSVAGQAKAAAESSARPEEEVSALEAALADAEARHKGQREALQAKVDASVAAAAESRAEAKTLLAKTQSLEETLSAAKIAAQEEAELAASHRAALRAQLAAEQAKVSELLEAKQQLAKERDMALEAEQLMGQQANASTPGQRSAAEASVAELTAQLSQEKSRADQAAAVAAEKVAQAEAAAAAAEETVGTIREELEVERKRVAAARDAQPLSSEGHEEALAQVSRALDKLQEAAEREKELTTELEEQRTAAAELRQRACEAEDRQKDLAEELQAEEAELQAARATLEELVPRAESLAASNATLGTEAKRLAGLNKEKDIVMAQLYVQVSELHAGKQRLERQLARQQELLGRAEARATTVAAAGGEDSQVQGQRQQAHYGNGQEESPRGSRPFRPSSQASSDGSVEAGPSTTSATLRARAEMWAHQRSHSSASDRSAAPSLDSRPPSYPSPVGRPTRSLPDTTSDPRGKEGTAGKQQRGSSYGHQQESATAPIPPRPRSSMRRPTSAASAPPTHVGSLPWRAQNRDQRQTSPSANRSAGQRVYSAGPTRPAHQQRTVLLK